MTTSGPPRSARPAPPRRLVARRGDLRALVRRGLALPSLVVLALALGGSVVGASAAGGMATRASAQGDAADGALSPSDQRSMEFEAASGAQRENVPGGALMVGAYGAVFLLLLAYTASLGARHAKTTRELARLREDLEAFAERSGDRLGAPDED